MKHTKAICTKAILTIILVILCINLASAVIVTKVSGEKSSIFPWEQAELTLEVTNLGSQEETIKYTFSDDVEWSFLSDPLYVIRKIGANETLTTQITLKPYNLQTILYKQYDLPYTIYSETTGDTYSGSLKVFVRNPYMVTGYTPSVSTYVTDYPRTLDPRQDAEVVVSLENRNWLNLSDYTIELTSKVNSDNNQRKIVPLEPFSKAEVKFNIGYYDLQEPITDKITIQASIPSKNYTFSDAIVREIKILPYSTVRQSVDSLKKSFLKTEKKIIFYNDGNVIAQDSYREQASAFRRMFISAEPKAKVVEVSGNSYLNWDLDIKPLETKTITITESYRTLFSLIIITILLTIVYFYMRSPIVLRKECKNMTGEKDDGMSKVKVLIHIKNRTNSPIEGIIIVDKIPHIAKIEKETAVGSIQPTNVVKNEKTGTLAKWQIETLEPYEERIITYHILPTLMVLGNMNLSHAMAKFKNRRGTLSKAYSNSVTTE